MNDLALPDPYQYIMGSIFPPLSAFGDLEEPTDTNEIRFASILMYGTQGSGKTELANTISYEAHKRYPGMVNSVMSKGSLWGLLDKGFMNKVAPINILFLDDLTSVIEDSNRDVRIRERSSIPFIFRVRHLMIEITGYTRGLIVMMLGLHDVYGCPKRLRVEPNIFMYRSLATNKKDRDDAVTRLGRDLVDDWDRIVDTRNYDRSLWPKTAYKTRLRRGIVDMPKVSERYLRVL